MLKPTDFTTWKAWLEYVEECKAKIDKYEYEHRVKELPFVCVGKFESDHNGDLFGCIERVKTKGGVCKRWHDWVPDDK